MLKKVEIHGCRRLEKLPETLGDLVALEQLSLVYCSTLSALRESVGCLTKLRVLYIWACSGLFELPETFLQLEELDQIWLRRVHLDSVPNLANLRSLKLSEYNG
ncbi:unnamed protein product [Calypogeia fissa]